MPRTDSRGIPYAASLLSRLLTCQAACLHVSPELLARVIEVFASEVSARERRPKRDELVRRASLLAPAESEHARAAFLAAEARALSSGRRSGATIKLQQPAATVRECLIEAATYGRLPKSSRQFLRILQSTPRGD